MKFATIKWYIINDQNNGQYGKGDENDSTIKFDMKVIKPNLCDYSDVYILVTGDIAVVSGNQNTSLLSKTEVLLLDVLFTEMMSTSKQLTI